MDDVLNQDEIDALLGDQDPEPENEVQEDPSKPRSFDFTSQDVISRGRMPTLEMINERFVRSFRISLFNFLRKNPAISAEGIEVKKYSEYVHSLFVPTSLNMIKFDPFRGSALFVLDAKLVFLLVENFFGGDGKQYTKIEGREFTPTELRVVRMVLGFLFKDLEEAWKPLLPVSFTYKNCEINPALANIVTPTELVIICKFEVELEGGGGEFHLTFPYSMLEPIKDKLGAGFQSDRDKVDERWVQALRNEVYSAQVPLNCVLAEKQMKLKELYHVKKGDILPIELFPFAQIRSNDLPIFNGEFGIHNAKMAIKIKDKLKPGQ